MVVTPAAVAAAPYKRLDESVCAGENWKTFAKLSSDGRYFDIAALLVDRDGAMMARSVFAHVYKHPDRLETTLVLLPGVHRENLGLFFDIACLKRVNGHGIT